MTTTTTDTDTTDVLAIERTLLAIDRQFRRRKDRRAQASLALDRRVQRWSAHLSRDHRGWNRDGSRTGPGSGRAADWLDSGFDALAAIARAVHAETGYRDAVCRQIAHTLHTQLGSVEALTALPPCKVELVPPVGATATQTRILAGSRHVYGDQLASVRAQTWILWYEWHAKRWIGRARLLQLLIRLTETPSATISGTLASSILAYQRGRSGYETCSGGELDAAVKNRPDLWTFLLHRAPRGHYVVTDGTVATAMTNAHEERAEDLLRAAGYRDCLHGISCQTSWARARATPGLDPSALAALGLVER